MTFVELCCGSGALTLHLLGAKRPLLPYQGSKWRHRHAVLLKFQPPAPPTRILLSDPGPWGLVLPRILRAADRSGIIERLTTMAERDPQDVFSSLQHADVPADPDRFAAEFLFLQRLAYSGKAVGVKNGRWSSPGFNKSSAYGVAATDRFGEVKPMIPSLLRTLRSYSTCRSVVVKGHHGQALQPPSDASDHWVYIDPPYAGSTLYPNGDLPREAVIELARAWHDAGARVAISEAVPIESLERDGWDAHQVNSGRTDTSRFRGKQPEWLTVSPG